MPASQPAHFNLQEFTDVGQLLVGGRLYTYGYGTTGHKTAYTDPDGTVPHTYTLDGAGGMYIALNARGELPAPLYLGEGSYDICLKRADGSTVWTRKADGVENSLRSFSASLGAPSGSAVVGFLQKGAGAVARTALEKSREVVSIADFGATPDAPDNVAAINKAITHMRSVGGRLKIPQGRFRTSGNHLIDVAGGVVSVDGDGPAASVLLATGANTPLTISGASECAVRSIGFDHVDREGAGGAGDGLKVINTAYAVVDHVTVYGFLNGIKTEAALTTLFTKTLTRFCGIGIYLARGPQSCPNAITLLNCSSSMNKRFGLRIDEGATITVFGGSIEGNGWPAESAGFRGGLYLSNCGTEGGVGVTMMGVQLEQNMGKGDIHIAQTKNAETAFNILFNTIFPIDNVHFTEHAIYVENNVDVTLNVWGNSFKHIGTYTPSAARPYIKSEAPLQLTVNTCGDSKQFYSSLQTPDLGAWGPNVYRGSMFSSRGSVELDGGGAAVIMGKPYNLGLATKTGTGTFTCNFAKQMKDNDYQVMVNPTLGAKTDVVISKTASYFTVQFRDLNGNLVDSGFDFMVAGGV